MTTYVDEAEVVIEAGSGDWFHLYVHPDNWNVKIILESLLTAKFIRRAGGYWRLHYFDLLILREKLDAAGVESRGITDEAHEQLSMIQSHFDDLERMKSGEYNDELRPLLGKLLKTDPYEDQISCIQFLSSQFASGCFDEMGLGKTLECLATFAVWKHEGLADRALVITKNDVKSGWATQVQRHTGLSCYVLGNGTTTCLIGLAEYRANPADVLILNFESLIDRKDRSKPVPTRASSQIKQEIIDLRFDVVIIDEFHLIKNDEALRSQAVQEILQTMKPQDRHLTKLTLELEDGRRIQRVMADQNVTFTFEE